MVADAIRRVQVRVAGKVQGVWFRMGTQHEARRLGVSGWVRNLPDGRVELQAEGPIPDVESLLAWVRVGTPHADVEHVDVVDVPVRNDTRPFDVRS